MLFPTDGTMSVRELSVHESRAKAKGLQGKVCYHAMKASRGIATLIPHLCIRRTWVGNFRPRPLYSEE